MTLNDIVTSALAQLDRGHDPQTMEAYAVRLTGYANDAQDDLARALRFCRTETVTPQDGIVNTEALSRPCINVLSVRQLGHEVQFKSEQTGSIALPYNEEASITYVCCPARLALPGDVSGLPSSVHGLIVTYVVGRERMAGEVNTQRGANLYLSMYEAAKAKLRPEARDGSGSLIINRY